MKTGEPILILMIEDDPAHAEIAMRNFRKNNMENQVIHLTDGQQALDYLLRQGEYSDPKSSPRPHLILLDLRLPKVDGLDVLKTIKESECLKSIPIIILTTSEANRDIAQAYNLNVNSYLVKPMNFNDFSNLIETFGFYWVLWNKYTPCN